MSISKTLKKFLMFFVAIFTAFAAMFAFTGCDLGNGDKDTNKDTNQGQNDNTNTGDNTNTDNTKIDEETNAKVATVVNSANEQMTAAMQNGTITISATAVANLSGNVIPQNTPKQMAVNEDVILKTDLANNTIYMLDSSQEQYQIGNFSYSKYSGSNTWSAAIDENNTMAFDQINGMMDVYGSLPSTMDIMFALTKQLGGTLNVETLNNGSTQVTTTIDSTKFFNALVASYNANKDRSILDFINGVITEMTGLTFEIRDVAQNFADVITAEGATVKDALDYIGALINIDISNLLIANAENIANIAAQIPGNVPAIKMIAGVDLEQMLATPVASLLAMAPESVIQAPYTSAKLYTLFINATGASIKDILSNTMKIPADTWTTIDEVAKIAQINNVKTKMVIVLDKDNNLTNLKYIQTAGVKTIEVATSAEDADVAAAEEAAAPTLDVTVEATIDARFSNISNTTITLPEGVAATEMTEYTFIRDASLLDTDDEWIEIDLSMYPVLDIAANTGVYGDFDGDDNWEYTTVIKYNSETKKMQVLVAYAQQFVVDEDYRMNSSIHGTFWNMDALDDDDSSNDFVKQTYVYFLDSTTVDDATPEVDDTEQA